MTLFTISAMNTNNQMMDLLFCQYNLGYMGFQPIVNGIMMGCSVIGILLIPKLVKKFGKKKTAIGGLLRLCSGPSQLRYSDQHLLVHRFGYHRLRCLGYP